MSIGVTGEFGVLVVPPTVGAAVGVVVVEAVVVVVVGVEGAVAVVGWVATVVAGAVVVGVAAMVFVAVVTCLRVSRVCRASGLRTFGLAAACLLSACGGVPDVTAAEAVAGRTAAPARMTAHPR
jgi:hypothetical protein